MMYCRSVIRGKHLGFANAIDWPSTLDYDVRTPGVYCTILIAAAGLASTKQCNGDSVKYTKKVTVWR